MDTELFVQQVVNGDSPSLTDLSVADAPLLADRLKAEAERYFRVDPAISLRFADTIIQLGDYTDNLRITALGTLARADVLGFRHQIDEAWEAFNLAGDLYQQAGDEVGWARTRIGRLGICVETNSVEAALRDAETARQIFLKHQDAEKIARLDLNTAVVLNYLAEFQAAIDKCQAVVQFMEAHGGLDDSKQTLIYYIMGHAHQGLGNLRESQMWYERSREILAAHDEKFGMALVDLNLINLTQAQGQNKKALRLLHKTIDAVQQHLPLDNSKEMVHLIQGYLFLNRFHDARALAEKVIQHQKERENDHLALVLLHSAMADAALGDFDQVYLKLSWAEQILERLQLYGWLGTVHLFRGQVAFRQGDLANAHAMGKLAAEQFRQEGQQVSYLNALLLVTRVALMEGQIESALQTARDVQKIARRLQIPHLSYEAYLLLGKAVEKTSKPERALRYYQVATGIMERIQRSLVLTSRAEFLADKQDAIRAVVRLNLELGRTEAAFAALERAKAQVWLGYLGQLDHLRWLRDDQETKPLIDELARLREQHHWYYRAAHDPVFREQQHVTIPSAEAALEASTRERQLRALTEQLYLHSSVEDMAATGVVPVSEIQGCLSDGEAMVAYYNDGCQLWAFLLDAHNLEACLLPEPVPVVESLLEKLQSNINRALRTVPGSDEEKLLGHYALPLARRLYDALLRPFAGRLHRYQRLVVVPYGVLHYLPFQLLHDGQHYLIEQEEVVILPTASLITRQPPAQKRGAMAIAYSWDGRLQHTQVEAGRVIEHFGGEWYSEDQATQAVLNAPPCQVLHISAHGQYRIDQPEFSYIQLADGPLYTDDLFQHDLRYELVTLSACETGRSHAAAGDELIGLGRGFLFAGAGALIASLWRVNEAFTLELMDGLYCQLQAGASKAAALREAQCALMRAYPGLHPAFWGAFELIGNGDSLSQGNT